MSFLRWAGSKKQLGEMLANCWYAAQGAGGNGRYIEAFCGSGSFYFRLKPEEAILVDVNQALIDCFKIVRSHPKRLFNLLESYPHTEEFYYTLRAQAQSGLGRIARAARFIYLNRFCFNGLYRTNKLGHFNVPYGANRSGGLPSLEQLRDCSRLLKSSELICGDFDIISSRVREGDFVYMDPPYAKRNHSLDFQYGPDVFGINDLDRIEELMEQINAAGAFFVFSYVECEEISRFTERWSTFRVEVKRTIAADSSKRTKSSEVLITNI